MCVCVCVFLECTRLQVFHHALLIYTSFARIKCTDTPKSFNYYRVNFELSSSRLESELCLREIWHKANGEWKMVCGDNKTHFRISESSIGRLAVVCELWIISNVFVNSVRFASNEIRRFFFGSQFRIWWTVVFDVVRFTSFERNCFLRVNSALHTTDSKTKVENRETRRHKREKQ